jgi:hypothetical protein
MRIVTTHSAIYFAERFDSLQRVELTLEPGRHVSNLFSQRCGRGGLAMGSRQHWLISVLISQ